MLKRKTETGIIPLYLEVKKGKGIIVDFKDDLKSLGFSIKIENCDIEKIFSIYKRRTETRDPLSL